MAFQYHKSNFQNKRRAKGGKNLYVILICLFLVAVFFVLVKSFRASADSKNEFGTNAESTEVIQNSQSVPPSSVNQVEKSISGGSEAILYLVDPTEGVGSIAFGNASRQYNNGIFNLNITASLSEPDKTNEDNRIMYYEAWMVRPTPFDYISVGELRIDAEGKFLLTWSGARDESFFDYSKIIITLEVDDGDSSPAQNILSGEF